jgi:hypothetical protein
MKYDVKAAFVVHKGRAFFGLADRIEERASELFSNYMPQATVTGTMFGPRVVEGIIRYGWSGTVEVPEEPSLDAVLSIVKDARTLGRGTIRSISVQVRDERGNLPYVSSKEAVEAVRRSFPESQETVQTISYQDVVSVDELINALMGQR